MPITTWSDPITYKVRAKSSVSNPWVDSTWVINNPGSMVSTNHFPLNTDSDDGGYWLLQSTTDKPTIMPCTTPLWSGPVTVRLGSTSVPSLGAVMSDAAMKGLGSTAISRCAPTDPAFNMLTAIGELREGVPGIVGSGLLKERARRCREAGGEYLNVEFGWKPLVSDLKSFAKAVNNSAAIWDAYRKGSDQKTRASYHYPETAVSDSGIGSLIPYPAAWPHGFFQGSTVEYLTGKQWFKGAFKYHVPEPVGFGGKMAYWQSEASKILGLRLTPDVVWNLNPWTWALDWFANTGDLMTNVSNMGQDGLVLQYGYQMVSSELKTISAGTCSFTHSGQAFRIGASRTRVQKWNKRIGMQSPYGFNTSFSSLTKRQLAICVALGLGHA